MTFYKFFLDDDGAVTVGEDHYRVGKNLLADETETVSTTLLGTV